MMKNINPQIPETQKISRSKNTSKTIPRHIIVIFLKPKINRKIFKIARQSHTKEQKLKLLLTSHQKQ